jgi:short-subunit dehydrogenase
MMAPAVPRRVWITGASSGLGEALAREYAANGAQVLLTARPGPRLDAVCKSLAAFHPSSYPADVTVAAQLESIVVAMESAGELPDLAILNAGTYRPMGIADFDTDAIVELFALNFFAVARGIELLLPRFRARGSGHLAVVGSVAGDIGLPYAGPYSASKAAVMRLCESLRPEFERAGLNLSVVNPGFVNTPLTARNEFPMPFMISADRAATIIRRDLARLRFEIRFPLVMSLAVRLLSALPKGLSGMIAHRMLNDE